MYCHVHLGLLAYDDKPKGMTYAKPREGLIGRSSVAAISAAEMMLFGSQSLKAVDEDTRDVIEPKN